ncbi:hypothetical protein [Mucilaginibacter sp. dw_454]|uniref:hypothetical protein n=1 Tax=Mucilaginibacter sp. dw_454 TaxID=2720079 RepID=UPI001BD6851D|nr:hypothetical protein [Mucilaginibacter sp. dw_454]
MQQDYWFGEDRLHLESWQHHTDAWLIRVPLQHAFIDHVNSAELEKLMKKVDWQRAEFPETRYSPQLQAIISTDPLITGICNELQQLHDAENRQGTLLARSLEIKYWSLGPYDQLIHPQHRLDGQRLVHHEIFQPGTTPAEAYRQLGGISQSQHHEMNLNNINIMNTENLDYLKKNLLNLGFGDKVNGEMEKLITAKVPEFSLTTGQEYNKKKMDYTLHFKAGEQNDMYFFNRYEASLKNEADPTKDRMQTLFINRGHGVTAKEAFNLLEGRAVEKKLYNKENEPYTAWLKLDFKEKDQYGNHLLHKFGEGYGYNLEKTLANYPIKELNDNQQKEELLRSLRKGNAQQVSIEKDGQSHKYYLVAEPQYKTLNIYDSSMKSVKREQMLKQENRPDQSQSQSKKNSQKNQQENNPKKQQSRKQKVH